MLLGLLLAFGGARAGHSVPHAPAITTITPAGGSLTVVWTAPTDTGNSAITAYDVRTIETDATDKADDKWDVVDDSWTSGDLTHTVTGLTADVEVDVQVRAVNTDGDGDWSATESEKPLIEAPSITSVTVGDTSLTLSWSAPTNIDDDDITAYDLRYIETAATDKADDKWSVIEAATSGAVRVVLGGLTNGTGYDVQVRAVSASPGVWSATATGTPAEHGDTRADATEVALQSRVGGAIDPGTDVDFFELEVTEETGILIFTLGALDTVGELQDNNGNIIEENDDGGASHGPTNLLIWATLEAGTYYIKVTSFNQATGAYVLRTRGIQDSTGLSDARPIEVGGFENGIIDPYGDEDYFKLELSEETGVIIYMTGDINDSYGELLNNSGTRLLSNDDGFMLPDYDAFLLREKLAAGTYFIKVKSVYSDDDGVYSLYVDTFEEPGSTTADAQVLSYGDYRAGRIDPSTDVDYFRLDLSEETYVYVHAVSATVQLDGTLLDDSSNAVQATHYEVAGGTNDAWVYAVRDKLDAGTYYIKMARSGGADTGSYTLIALTESGYPSFVSSCEGITTTYSDPLYGCQWHLNNTGQRGGTSGEDIDVEDAWATNLGAGVSVAVVDNGLDYEHEDLRDNVDTSRNHDYRSGTELLNPLYSHGTRVAGIIAARDNSVGMRGVAPRATIYGYNFLRSSSDANSYDAATRHMATTAVNNNSWGPRDGPGLSAAPSIWETGIDSGTSTGLGGKGVFYVFTGGNGALRGDNSNFDGFANYYGVTAVCAVNDRGWRSIYSEQGANLWICAPSSGGAGIATVTNNDRYTGSFGGTSAAAPMVSGVAALMRSANTNLTWRDVKLILAASARKNDASDSGWETGGIKYGSSTEHYNFNHEYGFGVVDAKAALDLAGSWTNVPTMVEETADSTGSALNIPDTATTVTSSITMESDMEFIEFVEINTEFDARSFRDLRVELVSPSGAVSVLAVPLPNPKRRYGLRESFRFGSARHLGEKPAGTWTLRITDRVSGGSTGTLTSWSLTIYGHNSAPGTVSLSALRPQVDSQLTASLTDADNSISGLTWVWERSLDQSTWTTISGATAAAYTPITADLHHYLRATASYSDGHGPGKTAEGVSANPVQAAPPSEPCAESFRPRRPARAAWPRTQGRASISGPR